MKRAISWTVLAVSCLGAAGLATLAALRLHYALCEDSEGWAVFAFCVMVGPALAALMLLGGVVPAAILCGRGRERRDRVSLWVSGVTLAVTVAAWFLLDPLRRLIIFGT